MAQMLTLAVNFMGGKAKPQDFSICKEPPKSPKQKLADFDAFTQRLIEKSKA